MSCRSVAAVGRIAAAGLVSCAAVASALQPPSPLTVTRLDPAVAARYVGGSADRLEFPRVRAIDPATADVLARHEAGVELDGLLTLDGPTAEALARCRTRLGLDGLRRLDPEAADALARSPAHLTLASLDGLSSPTLARKLARQPGTLELHRIGRLEGVVADLLATGVAGVMLPSLEHLSHRGLAERLARTPPGAVHLRALSNLDAAGAAGLSAVPCDLYLPAISRLDEPVAAQLGRHRGVLQLTGLEDVSPVVIVSLLGNEGPLGLAGLTRPGHDGGPLPTVVLEAVERHPWPLGLEAPTVPPELAEAIRRRRAAVDLHGVRRLSLALATSLVNGGVVVSLLGIAEAEPGVARVLLTHRPKPGTGFVLPATARASFSEEELRALDRHRSIHFGNAFDKSLPRLGGSR